MLATSNQTAQSGKISGMADSQRRATEVEAARNAAAVATELSETDASGDRRRMARTLGAVRIVRRGAGAAAHTFASMLTWMTGQVMEMAPRLKVRDARTLRLQFPGKTDDEIAELLISHAARASAAVGGATGAWAALPVLPAFPAEIASETLALTGIEIKLVAELHETYGQGVDGTATERGRAYVSSWAHRRGVYMVPGGLLLVGGSPLVGQVRRRLAARVRRSAFSVAPLFTGAVAGAMINSRETRKLGNQIRDDLRRRQLSQLSGQPVIRAAAPRATPAAPPSCRPRCRAR